MHKMNVAALVAGSLFLILPFANARAQQSDGGRETVNITVSARIVETIELITIRNIQFGDAQPGQNQISISPTGDTRAGKMKATGRANAPIKVSYVRNWQLSRTDGPGKLNFHYEVAGNTKDDQSTAELLQNDNRDLHFNSDGEYYFWIGGQANIQNAQPGNYQGDFTIEIEYI